MSSDIRFTRIPLHPTWPAQRARFIFRERHERAHIEDAQLTASQAFGVISQQKYQDLSGNRVTAAIAGTENFQHVQKGDFVISLRTFEGGIEYAFESGCISPAYTILSPIGEVDSNFFRYLLKSSVFLSLLQTTVTGIRDGKSVKYKDFANLFLPVPDLYTQKSIASFLDRETARIDQLIEKKQRLVKVLEEKQLSTITAAVTKGLEPYVPMKSSSIEWIGEIPAHWKVLRLKLLTNLIQTGPFGSQLHSEEYIDNETPVINPSNIKGGRLHPDLTCTVDAEVVNRLARHKLQAGDIVFGRRGEMGRCALVSANETGWLCGTGCMKVQLNGRTLPDFTLIILQTLGTRELLRLECVGSTMDNLNESILSRIPVPIPPLEEQAAILAYLDSKNNHISIMQDRIIKSSNKIQEFRSALITAAVTGQIDVDSWSRRGNTDRRLDAIEEEISA